MLKPTPRRAALVGPAVVALLLPRRVPFVAARHPDEYYDAPSEYPVTVLNPWRLKEQTAENAKAAVAAAVRGLLRRAAALDGAWELPPAPDALD